MADKRDDDDDELSAMVAMALRITPILPDDPAQARKVLDFTEAFHKLATELRGSLPSA